MKLFLHKERRVCVFVTILLLENYNVFHFQFVHCIDRRCCCCCCSDYFILDFIVSHFFTIAFFRYESKSFKKKTEIDLCNNMISWYFLFYFCFLLFVEVTFIFIKLVFIYLLFFVLTKKKLEYFDYFINIFRIVFIHIFFVPTF